MSHSSNNPVPTLAALMETANAQWRLFDLGRRIQPISKSDFALIEDNKKPYPFPIQQKARMALVFWQQSQSQQAKENPFIWFLQFDLDEMGLLKLQQRDHYISLVIKALGEEFIAKNAEKSAELDNHPYTFTPDQNRQAAFNAQVKVALKQPASLYYEHVQAYFAGQLDIDKWQELSIQGIADFAARLSDGNNEQGLIALLPELSVQTLSVLGANLEHQQISLPLTQALIKLQQQKLAERDNEEVMYLLRCFAGSVAKPLVAEQLEKLLHSEEVQDQTLFIIIAGRFWSYLENKHLLHLFFEKLAANHDQELFNGLFADLVLIPTTRNLVLAMLRDPERPEHVSRALGAIFAQA